MIDTEILRKVFPKATIGIMGDKTIIMYQPIGRKDESVQKGTHRILEIQ